jgi:uracil-DNA glycosylase
VTVGPRCFEPDRLDPVGDGVVDVVRAMTPVNLLSEPVARRSVPRQPDARRLLARLESDVVECRACPRLVAWREQVAAEKRAAYRDEQYWGRPIPGFGDPAARIVVLGLAPAAHGANRTGRVFTGDRSGDWLFRAMHRAGLANQPTSVAADDGLILDGAWVTAAVKCAPPGNQPLPAERDACAPFLARELAALTHVRVIVCLGQFGFDAACRHLGVSPRPRFGHGIDVQLDARPTLVCSFHPSQQNTFTGRLTEPMLDAVFTRAVAIAAL